MNISILITVELLYFYTPRLTHAISHVSIKYLLSINYMPISIISPRIKYSPINYLVEALYPLPNYFNSIHMLRFWGGLIYS